jgi:hypothetical protein
MQALLRSAGVRPVLRATGAGVLAALLALLVLVRGVFELLDPTTSELAPAGAGSLIVLAAATLGGAAGAWQAALAGACAVASLVLSVAGSVDPGRALLELTMVAAGAAAGACALPALARFARPAARHARSDLRRAPARRRHHPSLLASGLPAQIANRMSGNVDAIAAGNGVRTQSNTDPNQGIEPLTQDSAFKPWERLGITEDELKIFPLMETGSAAGS